LEVSIAADSTLAAGSTEEEAADSVEAEAVADSDQRFI
jgi:hypothetical protein